MLNWNKDSIYGWWNNITVSTQNPKYTNRNACAKCEDPDQTAPKEQSSQGLHGLPTCFIKLPLKINEIHQSWETQKWQEV